MRVLVREQSNKVIILGKKKEIRKTSRMQRCTRYIGEGVSRDGTSMRWKERSGKIQEWRTAH